jgi:hypothetical protein
MMVQYHKYVIPWSNTCDDTNHVQTNCIEDFVWYPPSEKKSNSPYYTGYNVNNQKTMKIDIFGRLLPKDRQIMLF